MKYFLLFLIFPLFCYGAQIKIKTSDGCEIIAYEKISHKEAPILLEVHGLGSNKEEWNVLNLTLDKEGLNYLALDLRGHGKSVYCGKKKIDYKNFSIEDWGKIILDWEAAYSYLLKKFPSKKIIPTGASIGANSAAIFSKNKELSKLILLSPGYEYVGLKPAEAISQSKAEIFFSYSPSDAYSAKSCDFFSKICSNKNLKCFFLKAEKGHGVQIFDSSSGNSYAAEIIKFVKSP